MTTIDAPREAAVSAAPVPVKRGRGHAGERAGIGTYIVLTLTAALFLFPFYFSLVAGSHPPADLYDGSPPLLPGPGLFTNMGLALQQANLFQALGRSLIVALVVTAAAGGERQGQGRREGDGAGAEGSHDVSFGEREVQERTVSGTGSWTGSPARAATARW